MTLDSNRTGRSGVRDTVRQWADNAVGVAAQGVEAVDDALGLDLFHGAKDRAPERCAVRRRSAHSVAPPAPRPQAGKVRSNASRPQPAPQLVSAAQLQR